MGGWYEAVGLGDTEKGTPRLLPHSLLPDRAWGQRAGLPAQARGAKATPLPQARSLAGDRHGSIFSRDRLSAEDPAGAAAKGEGSGERLRRRLNPATTKPGCPRSGRGKAGAGSPLTATCPAAGLGSAAASPQAAARCPGEEGGGAPRAQPASPPSLRTGADFGEAGGVHEDRLHPLHALREEAGAGPAALAGGRAVWPGAGEALPAPGAICRPEAGRHLLPRRRLAVLQHR